MPADAIALACTLLNQVEGCELEAYADPVTHGEPRTIGHGNTCLADGSPVRPGDRLPNVAAADALARSTLLILQRKLEAMVRVALQPHEEAALLIWQYNVGSGAASKSTLIRLLNEGNRAGAAEQFLVWDRSRGHVVPGLERRARLQRAVFLGLTKLATPTAAAPATASIDPHPTAAAAVTTAELNAAELARIEADAGS